MKKGSRVWALLYVLAGAAIMGPELTRELHAALAEGEIVSATMSWALFITGVLVAFYLLRIIWDAVRQPAHEPS